MHAIRLLALAVLCIPLTFAQTTQAWLSGRVTDSFSGAGIPAALVRCISSDTAVEIPFTTDAGGWYAFAGVSPGRYTLVISADTFQTQEYHQLDLPVAGQVTLDFALRPLSDVWEARRYESFIIRGNSQVLSFYGPDLDLSRRTSVETNRRVESNLEPSVSTVIRTNDLRELPLPSRDAYSLLVLLPGVTSDSSSGRGLGFSVNGQRPSAASYLLDGLENNNLLVTGPLGTVAPEFLAEYRISTNNYSAEYGRTGGFLANAVTRSGTNQWHGTRSAQGAASRWNHLGAFAKRAALRFAVGSAFAFSQPENDGGNGFAHGAIYRLHRSVERSRPPAAAVSGDRYTAGAGQRGRGEACAACGSKSAAEFAQTGSNQPWRRT
jgi:hypothetical protein